MNPSLRLLSRGAAVWLAALAAHGEVVINEFMAHGSERLLRWSADGVPTLGYGLPWYAPAHDDSRWLTGNGPFGFGSFTNVSPSPSFGTNTAGLMQNLTPTLYLRKSFQVSAADAARADALSLVVQFNDGFVLYLNGREVIRRNAGPPDGFVYHDQFAAFGTPATNEPSTTPYVRSEAHTLPAANTLLVPGDNLLAVHALNHWEGTFCTSTSTADPPVHTYVSVNNRDNFLFKGDLRIGGSSPVTLVSNNSAWRCFAGVAEPSGGVHDPALLLSARQSVPWGGAAYDDSAWTSGSAPHGAGPPPAGQTLGTDLSAALLNQTPSAYFRIVFTATAADLQDANALLLLVDFDDGFVAYLNGTEVARANMGQANAFTPHDAVASAERTPGSVATYTLEPPARLLKVGQNVLAVQVHNVAANNPDLFFRARLQRYATARILVDSNAAWKFFVGIQEPVLSESEAIEDNPEPPDSSLDWIELHNTSDSPVDLGAWSLSDDPADPVKWTFPAGAEIGAMGFLLVVCDGLDITEPASNGYLHTNFRLTADGEYLSLAEPGGHVVQQFAPAYPPQTAFQSYGRNSEGMFRYLDTPSPGSANTGPTFEGVVSPPEFSLQAGFHSGTQSLALSCATAGAEIRYTTDGSEPDATSGLEYHNPLSLGTSTAIRARAFLPGMIPSQTATRTFLVNEPTSRKSVPALCFTGDPQRALYRPFGVMAISGGSYVNIPAPTTYNTTWSQTVSPTPSAANLAAYNHPIHRGRFLERPVGLELLHPSGLTDPLNTLAGLRISGSGHARPRYRLTNQNRNPGSVPGPNDGAWSQTDYMQKPSFNLYFRDELGGDPLSYPLFPGSPVAEFHDVRLRAGKNDVSNPFVEDELMRRLSIDLGQVGSRGIINTLYVNGVYKGYYNLCEHLREDFFRRHHGSDLAWDVRQVTTIASGDGLAFQEMINFIRTNPQHLSANFQGMQARLDLVNFIDYLIVNLLGVTGDWPHNNYVAARERSTDAQYRYYVWDAEGAFGDFNGTVRTNQFISDTTGSVITTTPLTAGIEQSIRILYTLLKTNPEFRLLFADRLHHHFFNGGALTQARILARLGELRTELLPLLGTAAFNDKVTPWVNGVGESSRYTLSGGTTGTVVNAPGRSRVLFNGYTDDTAGGILVPPHLVDEGLWPTTRPPAFATFGGSVPAGFQLTITNTNAGGIIYFTTDGTDPRDPGGAVHGSTYTGRVTISFPTTVKARVLSGSVWSALTEALFDPGTSEPLLVTEIMYHPADEGSIDGDDFEFIELKNTGASPLALDGVRFTEGVSHTFPDGATLAPGTHLVLARNPARFALRYPGVPVAGSWDSITQLANQGERLTLVNAAGRTLFSVAWTDTAPWPEQADGAGHSLVPVQTDANPAPDNPASWRPSSALHGSPGADDPPPPVPVLVHELLANPAAPDICRLELHNPDDFAIDISHWWLSDDEAAPMKFRLPADTLIPARGFLVLAEIDWSPAGVSFPATGGTALLSAADAGGSLTGFRHCVTFGASDPGVSFGHHLNSAGAERFVAQSSNTFGAPNAGPRVGPVVITEIMYHPAEEWADEFLEIRNISPAPVPLFDPANPSNCWNLDGIGFTFPAGTVIQPGQTIVLSPIDPATFRARHGIKPGITIFGPFPGKLDNGGERIALQKPGPPFTPPSGTPVVPRIDVDALIYQDVAPWPVTADGAGPSLERSASGAFADDPAHWRASAAPGGSPGLPTALSFADWSSQRFTAGQIATPGIGGDSDDPDGDGLTNLAEWAFDTDPWHPDQAPLTWQMEPPDGSGHLTVRVRISQCAAGLGVFADTSAGLSAWLPGGGIPVDPAIDHGDGTETRVFRLPDPVAAHPRQFVRIRLTTQ